MSLLLFLLILPTVNSVTVVNSFAGSPTVNCGPDDIQISAETKNPFEGVVYVKNWRKTEDCYSDYSFNSTVKPSLTIPLTKLSQCGLELRRNAKKELEVFTVVIFAFHSSFMTQNDKSFALHCVFKQHLKTVDNKVSIIPDISPSGVVNGLGQTPVPEFKLVNGRIPDETLEQTSVAHVGDPLIFIWHLKQKSEVYGFKVKECSAQTLDGREIRIIENSCSSDQVIVSDVKHNEQNDKAFADGMAFKFPDVDDLWIKCKLSFCLRNQSHIKGVSSENICNPQTDCSKRKRRSVGNETLFPNEEFHLNYKVKVFDEDHSPFTKESHSWYLNKKWCFMKNVFSLMTALIVSLYVFMLALVVLLYFKERNSLKKLSEK